MAIGACLSGSFLRLSTTALVIYGGTRSAEW